MINEYEPKPVRIISRREEAPGVVSFKLRFVDSKEQNKFFFRPGQFLVFSLPGFGEAPVGIASSPWKTDSFEICVRRVGRLTEALHEKQEGEIIGIRGPFGRGVFPLKDLKQRNLLLIAGGIGIIPLRAVVLAAVERPQDFKKVQLFYGARCESDLLYRDELESWGEKIEVKLTVDKHDQGKCAVVCDEGLITKLFETNNLVDQPLVFIVGPPVMCKFVIDSLHQAGIKDDDIYISLERHMQCGVGECHHCGVGNKLVCEDGPVFKYSQIKDIRGAV